MLRGTVVSFSDEQAIGEVLLEDGRTYRFTLDALTAVGLPNAGAPAEVRVGPLRRGGEGVVAITLRSRIEAREEPAVFLDTACRRSCVWREAAGCFAEVRGDSTFSPGDLVTLTLHQEVAFRGNVGNGPHPFAIAARPGALLRSRARLDLRGALAVDGSPRSRRQAAHLRTGGGPPSLVRRPGGQDPRDLRARRRRLSRPRGLNWRVAMCAARDGLANAARPSMPPAARPSCERGSRPRPMSARAGSRASAP